MTAEERTLEMMATMMDAVCGPKKEAMMTPKPTMTCTLHGGCTLQWDPEIAGERCPFCVLLEMVDDLHCEAGAAQQKAKDLANELAEERGF